MLKSLFVKNSLKSRFSRFVILLLISLLFISAISLISNYQSLNRYNKTFNGFEQLLTFYENVEQMNAEVTSYIFSGDVRYLDSYIFYHDVSMRNLNILSSLGYDELVFRVSLLMNMISTYDEKVNNIRLDENQASNQEAYDAFVRLKTLIIETYPIYTELLTDEMKRDRAHFLRAWKFQLSVTIGLVLILLGISGVFVVRFLQSITRPIDGLVKNINLIKNGEFDIDRFGSDCIEIETLLSSFSDMAHRVDNNIRKIQEMVIMERQLRSVETDNLKITQLLTEAKLVALQHQMNPHFLFNTLSTISRLAYLEGAEKSSDLMVKTSRVLRYGIETGTSTSNLALEINCIKDYFEIQKIRMGERINFTIEVERDFADVHMPGMIVQPLIENCIIHGVQESVGSSYISVTISQQDDRAIIIIEDNGQGIPESLLEELNSTKQLDSKSITSDSTYTFSEIEKSEQGTKQMHLGIKNVRKRLALFYKDNYSLFFTSEIGCGTVITLEIPVFEVK